MLSTQNILSFDQGKLHPKGQSEDEFYARFVTKDAPEPLLEKRQAWRFLGWEWGGYPVETLK